MKVIFRGRDFSMEMMELPVKFTVERYSHSVYGGPLTAEITAEGPMNDLWELIERLRCPVEIYSDTGDCVWWGYVAQVDLAVGNVKSGATIDSMYNRIEVAYTEKTSGSDAPGQRMTTAWAQDDMSIDEYGIRELLLTNSGSSTAHAESARDMALESKKYPQPIITFGAVSNSRSVIYCRGWYSTLDWRYASIPIELAMQFVNAGTTDQTFGKTTGIEKIAQVFDISAAGINAAAVDLYVRKVGDPQDNLTFAIYSNPDDLTPTTSLVSGSVAGTSLTTSYAWKQVMFSSAYGLTANGTYFILVDRSGAKDDTNYYEIRLDGNQGYAGGPCVMYSGGAWAVKNYDMLFRLYADNIIKTSQQAKTIATAYGQFFSKIVLDIDSGISTESYRDGDGTAMYEFEELLKMGTSNKRRMLCNVDVNRLLRIYEEPTSDSPNLITSDGILRDKFDNPVRAETCPVGVWMRIKDVIPGSTDLTLLADPTLAFIDVSEYNARTNVLTLTPRNIDNPWDIGVPRDG